RILWVAVYARPIVTNSDTQCAVLRCTDDFDEPSFSVSTRSMSKSIFYERLQQQGRDHQRFGIGIDVDADLNGIGKARLHDVEVEVQHFQFSSQWNFLLVGGVQGQP